MPLPTPTTTPTTSVWWSRRALWLHLVLVVVVPTFVGLFWWQVQRVRQGNTLSWAYVFEWPFFTAYAIYLWWKLVHDQLGSAVDRDDAVHDDAVHDDAAHDDAVHDGTVHDDAVHDGAVHDGAANGEAANEGRAVHDGAAAGGDDDDEELAAYNRYLAELNASGRRKRW